MVQIGYTATISIAAETGNVWYEIFYRPGSTKTNSVLSTAVNITKNMLVEYL